MNYAMLEAHKKSEKGPVAPHNLSLAGIRIIKMTTMDAVMKYEKLND